MHSDLASAAHSGGGLLQFGFGNDMRQCGISRGSHEAQPEQVGATEGPKWDYFNICCLKSSKQYNICYF